MDKKDIYEHLAKIYLDASRKKKTGFLDSIEIKDIFSVTLILVFIYVLLLAFINFPRSKYSHNPAYLALEQESVKIVYNSNPVRNTIASFDLSSLNLKKFNALEFSLRKTNYEDNIALKVELSNFKNERSVVYLKNLDAKWQGFRIYLSEFSHILDWSKLRRLNFSVVEKNRTSAQKGAVYINEIKFIK